MSFYHPTTIAKSCIRGREGVLMSHMYTSCVAVLKKLRSKSYVIIMSCQIRKRVLARWPRLKIHTINYQHRMKRNYAEGQKNKQNSEMTKDFQNGLQQNKLWVIMDLMLWRTYFRQKKRKPKTALIIWRLDCKLSGCLKKKKTSRKKHTDKLEVDLAMVHGGSYLERKCRLIALPSLRILWARKIAYTPPSNKARTFMIRSHTKKFRGFWWSSSINELRHEKKKGHLWHFFFKTEILVPPDWCYENNEQKFYSCIFPFLWRYSTFCFTRIIRIHYILTCATLAGCHEKRCECY